MSEARKIADQEAHDMVKSIYSPVHEKDLYNFYYSILRERIFGIITDAVRAERERCAIKLELSTAQLKLMAGEMTAQEVRTVKAVLNSLAQAIRQGEGDKS